MIQTCRVRTHFSFFLLFEGTSSRLTSSFFLLLSPHLPSLDHRDDSLSSHQRCQHFPLLPKLSSGHPFDSRSVRCSFSPSRLTFPSLNPCSPLLSLLRLLAFPIGKVLAWVLPIQDFTLPAWLPYLGGSSFTLNPGPFNMKVRLVRFRFELGSETEGIFFLVSCRSML